MRSNKEIQLIEKLEMAAKQHGFDLVDIERAGSSRNALLRVFIDKEGGLTLDEIAAANAWVSEVVEEMDPYAGSYTLEVSSPGIDRPLRTFAHYVKAVGEEIVVQLEKPLLQEHGAVDAGAQKKPRLKYSGVVESVDVNEQSIVIKTEDTVYTVPFKQVKKARVKGKVEF